MEKQMSQNFVPAESDVNAFSVFVLSLFRVFRDPHSPSQNENQIPNHENTKRRKHETGGSKMHRQGAACVEKQMSQNFVPAKSDVNAFSVSCFRSFVFS